MMPDTMRAASQRAEMSVHFGVTTARNTGGVRWSSQRGGTTMAVVTISRQFGSQGDEIGQAVARELGVPYLDKAMIRLTAERIGMTAATLADPEQRVMLLNRLIPLLVLGENDTAGWSAGEPAAPVEPLTNAVYHQAMAEVIRDLAAGGGAVIVGRGGQMILRAMPGVLHIAIGASLPTRIARVTAETGLSLAAAERRIEASDRQRADFLRTEYGGDWQAPALYDLILTTDRLPVEAATAAIVAAARALAARTQGEATYRRLRQDHYTVKEAADLLQRNPEVIRHAVYAGDLPAKRAGQAIISITRKDLLAWLEREAVPHA
jgi:cytidylate kinase